MQPFLNQYISEMINPIFLTPMAYLHLQGFYFSWICIKIFPAGCKWSVLHFTTKYIFELNSLNILPKIVVFVVCSFSQEQVHYPTISSSIKNAFR